MIRTVDKGLRKGTIDKKLKRTIRGGHWAICTMIKSIVTSYSLQVYFVLDRATL